MGFGPLFYLLLGVKVGPKPYVSPKPYNPKALNRAWRVYTGSSKDSPVRFYRGLIRVSGLGFRGLGFRG